METLLLFFSIVIAISSIFIGTRTMLKKNEMEDNKKMDDKEKNNKANLLFKTMKSLTNITPDKEQVIKIEDIRIDFKNLSAKIINYGLDESYLEEAIKAMELSLFWTLKSILVVDYEDMGNENE